MEALQAHYLLTVAPKIAATSPHCSLVGHRQQACINNNSVEIPH
jgi:hypothetical protein